MDERDFEIRDGLRETDVPAVSAFLRNMTVAAGPALSGNGADYVGEKCDPERVEGWSDDIVFTAWNGEQLIGFARARKDGFVTHVFVEEGFRGFGLGTRLLTILEETLAATGTRWIFLDADPGAVPFYERNDWVRRESATVDPDTVLPVPMEKKL